MPAENASGQMPRSALPHFGCLALTLDLSLLSLRADCTTASSPLWGRTEEGGRAVLSGEPAMAHSIIPPSARPAPARPHKGGGCAKQWRFNATQRALAYPHGKRGDWSRPNPVATCARRGIMHAYFFAFRISFCSVLRNKMFATVNSQPMRISVVGATQFGFFSPSGRPALRRPSVTRWYRALKVGSSLQWMEAQPCTVKPG